MAVVSRLFPRVFPQPRFAYPIAFILSMTTLALSALPGSNAAQATEILPHKAIYTLHNREVSGGDEDLSADGMLVFEWLDTCDG